MENFRLDMFLVGLYSFAALRKKLYFLKSIFMESLRNAQDYQLHQVRVQGDNRSLEVGVGTVMVYKEGTPHELSGTSLEEIRKVLGKDEQIDHAHLKNFMAGVVYGSKPDEVTGEKKPQFLLLSRTFRKVEDVLCAVQSIVDSALSSKQRGEFSQEEETMKEAVNA